MKNKKRIVKDYWCKKILSKSFDWLDSEGWRCGRCKHGLITSVRDEEYCAVCGARVSFVDIAVMRVLVSKTESK